MSEDLRVRKTFGEGRAWFAEDRARHYEAATGTRSGSGLVVPLGLKGTIS